MEDAIIHKVAGYANTPIGINIMRNLLVLGPLLGSMDPEVLGAGVKDLTSSVMTESKNNPQERLRRSEGYSKATNCEVSP